MPELPEVESARRAIEEHCIGKKIKKAIVANDEKVINGVSPADFEAALVGKTLISAVRKGKILWLQLDSPPLSHFLPSNSVGMAGAVYIKGVAVTKYKRSAVKDTDEWPSKYSKVFIELDDGLEFSFTDKRQFAKVRFAQRSSVPPISELGPDALLEPMSVDELHESLSRKKIAIKALLHEQARIHPLQNASTLSKESCTTLHKCIKEVIEKALEVGADSSQFPKNWIFLSREKKPGKAFVDGKKIDFITVGSRTTAYVPELQKLVGNQTTKVKDRSKQEKDDVGDEDGATEESGAAKPFNLKREMKPRGLGRNPPTKRKSTSSDDDNEDDNEDGNDEDGAPQEEKVEQSTSKREVKPGSRGKKPSARKKSNSSDDDNEDDSSEDASNDEINNRQKRQWGRVNNNKPAKTAEKASKKAASNRNTRSPKKKVK